MSPAKKEISLLPDEVNSNTTGARVIRWITSIGRFVIVFTELIVIGAFLSRFYLDRKNSDLSDVIRQQTAIIESTQNFENDFNLLQKKINLIKQIYASQPEYQSKIDTLVASTPPDITFESLVLKSDDNQQISADLSLTAFQESSIIDFMTNLIVNPKIKSVDVQVIEKKPKDTKYTVSLSISFVNAPTN